VRDVERLFVPFDDARHPAQGPLDAVERAHRRLLTFTLQEKVPNPGAPAG
jgi:hypothetical protein